MLLLLMLAAPAAAGPVDRWNEEIGRASRRFGIPEQWIRRVMEAESGGQTRRDGRPIRSRAGAIGLMQLMPQTWAAMQRAHGLGSDPDDPADNILAGAAYLRAMYDRFGYPGLFAAYNAGPARFADHLETGRKLPAETVAYLESVAGRGRAAANRNPKPAVTGLFAVRPGAHRDPASASRTADRLFVRLRTGPNARHP